MSCFGFGQTNNQLGSTSFSGLGQPMRVIQMEQTGSTSIQSTEDCFDRKDSFGGFGSFGSEKKETDQEMIKEYLGMMLEGELNDIRVWMDNTNVMNPTFYIDLKKNAININGNSVEIYPVTIRKEIKEGREFLTIVFEGREKNIVKFHLERKKKVDPNQSSGFGSFGNGFGGVGSNNPNDNIKRYVYANINGYIIANGKALVIDIR